MSDNKSGKNQVKSSHRLARPGYQRQINHSAVSYLPQHPYCYVQQPLWGWGSYDQFRVQQSVPLPPVLPPLRNPSYLPLSGMPLPQTETRLRRWGNYPLHLTQNTGASHSRASAHKSCQILSRSNIGSIQQLPPASFVEQAQKWNYSCRDLERPSASSSLVCVFCKSNREPPEVFSSHVLKDANGVIKCPILRKYQCRFCGATGDFAHTDSYCSRNPNRGLQSSMKSVLQTRVMSSGKIRTESPN